MDVEPRGTGMRALAPRSLPSPFGGMAFWRHSPLERRTGIRIMLEDRLSPRRAAAWRRAVTAARADTNEEARC